MSEEQLDISNREVFIGLRNKRPTQEGLAGRKLARVEFAPYATPNAPDRWIKVVADTPSARWMDRKIGHDAICEVTAPRDSLALAVLRAGIALLPAFVGDRQDTLARRGDTAPELAHDQWRVTHQDDRHLPEVRQVLRRLYGLFDRG